MANMQDLSNALEKLSSTANDAAAKLKAKPPQVAEATSLQDTQPMVDQINAVIKVLQDAMNSTTDMSAVDPQNPAPQTQPPQQ